MRKPIAVAGLALTCAGPVAGQGSGPPLTMTCHEMVQGVPQRDETVYMLIGDTLFRKGYAGQVRISTAGRPLDLGSTRDAGGRTLSAASHVRQDRVVVRTLTWSRPGRAPYRRFVDRYDFARQTVIGRDGRDSCHHDAF